jgi:hypothetical protein
MVRAGLLDGEQPSSLVPELRLGLDRKAIGDAFAHLAQMDRDDWDRVGGSRFRVQVDDFVEPPAERRAEPPLPLVRGLPPPPALSAASLRAAALAGGHYLAAHLGADGRFDYEVNLTSGEVSSEYNLPRHSGASYFLAQLYRLTGDTTLRDAVVRAFDYMSKLIGQGRCSGTTPEGKPWSCLVEPGSPTSSLGSTALAVVALAEYETATQDTQYHELMTRMAEFVLWMQRDDGSFRHYYDVRASRPDQDSRVLYFDGEATLAMVRMRLLTGDVRYQQSAVRALDFLVGWYDWFVGGFLYGEDHWTCIAAEALSPAVKDERWLSFCNGFARFLRTQQQYPGDLPAQEDWAGAYNLTPFVAPHNTPAGSRTEAMISTYLLGVAHGEPNAEVRAQVLSALQYLLGQQIGADAEYDVDDKARGRGAMPKSPLERTVRIDYVQHGCSAMVRAAMFLEQEGG